MAWRFYAFPHGDHLPAGIRCHGLQHGNPYDIMNGEHHGADLHYELVCKYAMTHLRGTNELSSAASAEARRNASRLSAQPFRFSAAVAKHGFRRSRGDVPGILRAARRDRVRIVCSPVPHGKADGARRAFQGNATSTSFRTAALLCQQTQLCRRARSTVTATGIICRPWSTSRRSAVLEPGKYSPLWKHALR